MSFTRQQVEAAVLNMEFEDEYTSFFDEIRGYRSDEEKSIEIPGIGLAHFVDRTGGHEDDGTYMDVIFKINDNGEDRFFRKVGSYDSWDSDEWDGAFEEVKHVQVQRMQWENIRE